jgi:site-specific DNA recombinase
MAEPGTTPATAGHHSRAATHVYRSRSSDYQPLGVEPQERRLRHYLAAQTAWSQLPTSATTPTMPARPGLRAALDDARAGRFDILLGRHSDQIRRHVEDVVDILDDLERAGGVHRVDHRAGQPSARDVGRRR